MGPASTCSVLQKATRCGAGEKPSPTAPAIVHQKLPRRLERKSGLIPLRIRNKPGGTHVTKEYATEPCTNLPVSASKLGVAAVLVSIGMQVAPGPALAWDTLSELATNAGDVAQPISDRTSSQHAFMANVEAPKLALKLDDVKLQAPTEWSKPKLVAVVLVAGVTAGLLAGANGASLTTGIILATAVMAVPLVLSSGNFANTTRKVDSKAAQTVKVASAPPRVASAPPTTAGAPPKVASAPPVETTSSAPSPAAATAEAKAKSEAETKAKTETETKAKAEAETKAKAEAETKAKAEAETKAKAEAETKAKTEAEAKAKAEAETKAKTESENEAKAKAEAEAEAKARETQAQAKARAQAEAQAAAVAEAKAAADSTKTKAAALAIVLAGALLTTLQSSSNDDIKMQVTMADGEKSMLKFNSKGVKLLKSGAAFASGGYDSGFNVQSPRTGPRRMLLKVDGTQFDINFETASERDLAVLSLRLFAKQSGGGPPAEPRFGTQRREVKPQIDDEN